jgi:hypothetical protein
MNATLTINNEKNNDLYSLLSQLSDYRQCSGRRHELQLVLIIAIMSIMSGYTGIRQMGDFIEKNRKELLKLFQPDKDRLPSRQTVGRVLQHIDFDKLNDIFHKWAIGYVKIKDKEWVSIDGKAIGSTVGSDVPGFQKFVNLVSIFASKRKQVLSAGKILNHKESEIPKVRELIKELGLEGVIFTLDALHCQKETVKTITESGNDYCIGVKGNQKTLHERIKKKCKRK